jgi:hypothetical protein
MWSRFAWAALGVASLVAAGFVPVAAPYLVPAGAMMLGVALPSTRAGLVKAPAPAATTPSSTPARK